MGRTELEWVGLGRQRILEVLDEQGAATRLELQTRISELPLPPAKGLHVDPAHVTTALRQLLADGAVVEMPAPTRGGRSVPVLHLPVRPGQKRRIERAAMRKRLLHARYLSWSSSRRGFPHGLIGTAGERVFDASIRSRALASRYGMVYESGKEVTHLLGQPVEGGALDSAGWLSPSEGGVPGAAPVLVVFEIKNVREWIYPGSELLHPLLYKAARLQEANKNTRILPVLVCRRRAFTTLRFGQDLGVAIVELKRQFLWPAADIRAEAVTEVQQELGFQDLVVQDEEDETAVAILKTALPGYARAASERWAEVGSAYEPWYDALRNTRLGDSSRSSDFDELRAQVREDLGDDMRGGW